MPAPLPSAPQPVRQVGSVQFSTVHQAMKNLVTKHRQLSTLASPVHPHR
jgi:hypothetical protein